MSADVAESHVEVSVADAITDDAAPPAPPEETSAVEAPTEEPAKTEAPAPEPTEEEKAEAAKQAEVNRRWKIVEAAKRQQLEASRVIERAKQREDRAIQYESRLQSKERELAHREQRLSRFEKGIADHDLGVLQEFGYSYEKLTRHQLEANTPEGIAKQAIARAEALERREHERQQHQRLQDQIQETRRNADTLVRIVDESAAEFPDLYEWAPERIAHEGIQVRDALYQRDGRMPTYDDVLSILSTRAKQEVATREQRKARLQQTPAVTQQQVPKVAASTNGQTAARPQAPTIAQASAKPTPKPAHEMSESEWEEWATDQLRQAKRGASAKTT